VNRSQQQPHDALAGGRIEEVSRVDEGVRLAFEQVTKPAIIE
jgi:hypothetical protein